jgi:hypothetical protein
MPTDIDNLLAELGMQTDLTLELEEALLAGPNERLLAGADYHETLEEVQAAAANWRRVNALYAEGYGMEYPEAVRTVRAELTERMTGDGMTDTERRIADAFFRLTADLA